MPGAGHIVHMPSHIYWRVGRYADAVAVNAAAVQADRVYFKTAQPSPIYRGLYYPHNIDFIWQSASMQGRSAETMRAAREFAEQRAARDDQGDAGHGDGAGGADRGARALRPVGRGAARIRRPPREWLYTARRVALRARPRVQREGPGRRGAPRAGRAGDAPPVGAGRAHGGVLLPREEPAPARGQRAGRRDRGEGRRRRDAPSGCCAPPWPSRTRTGSPSRRRGTSRCARRWAPCCSRPAAPRDAEQVYREDLKRNPGNGWSLFGLAQSLRAQGKTAEAARAEASFRTAWAQADVTLTASRF